MKVEGGYRVAVARPEDELPQKPNDGRLWQDSFPVCWFDPNKGIGGINRLSQEPNYDGGRSIEWNTLFTLDGYYYRVMQVHPMLPGDRGPDFFNAGRTAKYSYDGNCRWQINAKDAELDLKFTDYHEPVANIPLKEGDDNVFYSGTDRGHFETAGRVQGTARVGDHRYEFDGIGYRNHSWGVRNWNDLLSHKWIAGALNKDFSFAVFSWHTANGDCAAHGHVVRNHVMTFARSVDIIVYTDIDSISHRGCMVKMVLTNGEELRFDVRPICKGTMGSFHGTLVPLTGPCTVSHNGLEGICIFETSTNLLGGERFPKHVINGITDQGLIKVSDWKVPDFQP